MSNRPVEEGGGTGEEDGIGEADNIGGENDIEEDGDEIESTSPAEEEVLDKEDEIGEDGDGPYVERKYVILIIYDIISNKQRVKMAKLLSGYGIRVQKSAFEARLNKKQYARLLADIRKMLKADDNIRLYKLHGYEEIVTFGDKEYEVIEDVIVI